MCRKFYIILIFLFAGQNLLAQDSTQYIGFTKREHSKARLFVLLPRNKLTIKLIDNQQIKGKFSSVDSQNIYVYYKSYDSFGRFAGNYMDTVVLDSISTLKVTSIGRSIFGGILLVPGISGTALGVAGLALTVNQGLYHIAPIFFSVMLVSSMLFVYQGIDLLKQDRFDASQNHYFIFKVSNKKVHTNGRIYRDARSQALK